MFLWPGTSALYDRKVAGSMQGFYPFSSGIYSFPTHPAMEGCSLCLLPGPQPLGAPVRGLWRRG